MTQEDHITHFDSRLSDSTLQNTATTYYHMDVLIEHLIKIKIWLRVIVYMETQIDQEHNTNVPMLFVFFHHHNLIIL